MSDGRWGRKRIEACACSRWCAIKIDNLYLYLYRITIFMSKFTFSGSVTANVPLKMTPDGFNHTEQESPAVAREDALQAIQLLLQYWPSRSSKVYEFHLIWKTLSHFLLVINSNLGSILYLETFHWKLQPNRCRWRHGYYWKPIGSCHRSIRWYCLATIGISLILIFSLVNPNAFGLYGQNWHFEHP